MNIKYEYRAFGLNIESEVVLDGLLPSEGPADVRIIEGELHVEFSGPEGENAHWSAGKDKFAFRVKGLGAFLITNGNEIILQKGKESHDDALALFILGTCMGALLIQRGFVPIHGSALSLNSKEVIITGESGAGKSSLTASLNKQGYSFLADDISALQIEENGDAWILPAFPKQKLCRDTATLIFGGVEGLEPVLGIRDKYHVSGIDQFISNSRKLCVLFELSIHSGEEVELEEVYGTEKLATIMKNTYRFELIEVKGLEAKHFLQCSKIASRIKVFKIKRPASGFTVNEQINKMLKVLDYK